MVRPWLKWCINHNLKFIVYVVWLFVVPLFWFVYLEEAMKDAVSELNYIKSLKKGQ